MGWEPGQRRKSGNLTRKAMADIVNQLRSTAVVIGLDAMVMIRVPDFCLHKPFQLKLIGPDHTKR